jgi:uncharacterized protein YodC (DUF2158 family)
MAEFKVGDVVQLISGGPEMTVSDVKAQNVSPNNIGRVACQWFAGKKLESGYFPTDSLVKVVADKKEG